MENINTATFNVMNNKDLFRHIFTFLRSEAELKCENCNFIIQWDNSKPRKCDYVSNGEKILCFNCWFSTQTACTIS